MKQEPAVQKDKEIFFHHLREHGREKKKKGSIHSENHGSHNYFCVPLA